MKKLLYTFLFIFSCISINAQLNLNYGIKAGLNYSISGDLNIVGGFPGLSFDNTFQGDRNIAYHLGVFAQANFPKIYVRSELLFSKSKTTYRNSRSNDSHYNASTLELPILLGYKLSKPFSIYIGPSFQYHIDNEFDDFGTIDLKIDKDFVLGLNIGAALQVYKFGIDLRYMSHVSKNEAINFDAVAADGPGYILDTKSNQIILSLSYQIN